MRRVAAAALLPLAAACGSGSGEGVPDEPTFARDVAPIVFDNCAPCHRPDGPAPFPLLSYDDARRRASQIATVTVSGYMPPWLPEPGFGSFADARGLTPDQVETLRRWAAQGAPQGDPARQPPAPTRSGGWQLGTPDLVLEMDATYTLPEAGEDVYRNFVIPVPVETRRWVRTVELQPGNPKVVHHARLEVDPTWRSRYEDGRDAEPGYDGMLSVGGGSPDGHFVGWTPGQVPRPGEPDMAWPLDPGTSVVLQLHMLPSGRPEPIRARVGLYFADQPPTRRPLVLRLGPNTIDIPAGESHWVLRDRFELPVGVKVLGVYPHAHYVAKAMKGWATLPDGRREWLIRIDDWDFNWQDDYRYQPPVELPRGSVLEMEYVYDNSTANVRNPNQPPQRVTWGLNSSDEMGDLILQVLPATDEERLALQEVVMRRENEAVEAGYRVAIGAGRHLVLAHTLLGSTLLGEERLEEAVAHFQEALALEPGHGLAEHGLGTALLRLRRFGPAAEAFRRSLADSSENVEAHYGLAMALQAAGRPQAALDAYREVLSRVPQHDRALYGMGMLLRAQGRGAEAIEPLRRAVAANPDLASAHVGLAAALEDQGRLEEAVDLQREAARLRPGDPGAVLALARTLDRAGHSAEAAEELRRVIAAQPELADARYELAVVLKRLGDLDGAVAELEQAVRLRPAFVEALNDLATGLVRLRRLDEAELRLRQAVEAQPRFADAWFNLGVVRSMQGRADEAAAAFAEAVRLEPRYRERLEAARR